jgi:hypothetical protein
MSPTVRSRPAHFAPVPGSGVDTALELVAFEGRVIVMSTAPKLTSVVMGVVAFVGGLVFLFPIGCADVGGMSSWERCSTVMGNPAFSVSDWGFAIQFDLLIPFAVGLLVGGATWWLLASRDTGSK